MNPWVDYHMHTPLCGHASGEPREYAQRALDVGIREIGFSDHAPFVRGLLPGITMSDGELPRYHDMVRAVQKEFSGRLTIKFGIEADYIPGYEEKTRKLLERYPFDYVYGSVHFIDGWGFDNPDERQAWSQVDVDQVYRAYYRLLRASAETELFDIIAHVDLVKKFGYRPSADLTADLKETARVFKEHGLAIEINTAGLRKEVKEIYPSLDILKVYVSEGVPITFGSDAHLPSDVGADFDKARDLALAAGCKEYVLFKDRLIEKTVALL